jgi:hypothetical protein
MACSMFEQIVYCIEGVGAGIIDDILNFFLEEIAGKFDDEVFSGEDLERFFFFFKF